MSTANKKAVFFDRDGTLNVDIHYLHRPEDFAWIEGAKEAIKYVNDLGYLAILVTNQSGVARGYYPEEDVKRVYDWMNGELARIGAHLDALYYCPHHPEGKIPQYAKACTCRKPQTGMVDKACTDYGIDRSQSYFVGDSDGDMECARRAGLTPIRYGAGSLLDCLQGFIVK
ncbi:D-glycero-D-manno-heptose 1,7-bisphosphate phosphatase [Selenomonas sp. GACV-9]|uniref:D-glycero-alpha-D-manno-heptose-1,7-bisphosphate 7-phosphatase n=1 Tax=Selenomonas sp. GACV-9 TaxID=3158782 RepID=UPI0008ED3265|nr:D-glycero-D-manno-heptose 1,7-bisphosphate phosphatase [Selenomonas ruminantium]